MPIISENPKEVYENLYKELKDKYSPISVYLKDQWSLPTEQKNVGKAINDFIKYYEKVRDNFTTMKDFSTTEEEVTFADANYKLYKDAIEKDEEKGRKLELLVDKIRDALLDSVALGPDYDYNKAKTSADDKERFAALDASTSDRIGSWFNEAYDKEEKKLRERNLEFAHRPEVFLKVKDPKTQKIKTIKAERYVPYTERFSKKYRFFNRETSQIKYDRSKDPDAYVVAPLTLRDVLENHKVRKAESDRRREYVKFINSQHQAYAVWKEQMPKEKEKYMKLVMELSEETRKHFNDVMSNYNSVTSGFSGVIAWLEKEKENYAARKQVIEEAKVETSLAKENYDKSVTPYEEYLSQMDTERKIIEDEVEAIRKDPLMDEKYRQTQVNAAEEYSKQQKEIENSLELLEKEIQNDTDKQNKTREMLMDTAEKVKQYKEQVKQLKEAQTKENKEAVKNYYRLLFDSEVEISTALTKSQNELMETLDDKAILDELMDKEAAEMIKVEADLIQIRAEIIKDNSSLEKVKELAGKLSKKEVKELQSYMQTVKDSIKNHNVPEEEKREAFASACMVYAKKQEWEIGTDLIYFDATEAKQLSKRLKENQKEVEKLTIDYDKKKTAYKNRSESLNEIRGIWMKKIDELEAAIDNFGLKLDTMQNENRDKEVDQLVVDLDSAVLERTNKEGQVLTEAESEIEKGFKELSESIRKKVQQRNEIREKLIAVEEKRLAAENEVKKCDDLKLKLEEKQQQFKELVEKQEEKKNQLNEAKETARKEWEEKKANSDKVEKEAETFVKDYELVFKKFDEDQISSLRRMEDMSKLVQAQQEKLTKDSEAQKQYLRDQEDVYCAKLRKDFLEFKYRLLDVAEPQGRFKSSNSREFTEFKNIFLTYLEPTVLQEDPYNPGQMIPKPNKNYILDKLETINAGFNTSDAERKKLMQEIRKAMVDISAVTQKYLKAKGSPHRSTEQGRARYALASQISILANDTQLRMTGLLCGKQLCNIAPDLGRVTDKSGLNVDFKQTDGYKYAKNAIDRETDIFDPDVFRNIKESEQKETAPVKA